LRRGGCEAMVIDGFERGGEGGRSESEFYERVRVREG
jgi:hypothetical protein